MTVQHNPSTLYRLIQTFYSPANILTASHTNQLSH